MSSVFGQTAKGSKDTTFRVCQTCNGMGFLQKGEFAARDYIRCTQCKGAGQLYINPTATPPADG